MTTITRFYQPPDGNYFLFGPRGTGKSTLLKQLSCKTLRIDLLDRETFRLYAAHPERLRDRVATLTSPTRIILDEVQKIPELLDVVHQLMEEKQNHTFILTGSSARKLKRSGVDLLLGFRVPVFTRRAKRHIVRPNLFIIYSCDYLIY